jgi:predicted DNA-binding transcriptional regulator YafY
VKSTRLLSALMLLQAHGRLSSRELAERLEVSERTAHRDMEALSEAGVPVFALRGAQGGWELAKGWRTKVPGLDEAELRALLMAQPSALGDPKLAAAAERAFGKLMAALPSGLRDQAASLRAQVHIDATGWRPSAEDVSMLPPVQDAIARSVKLAFDYTKPNGETTSRTVRGLRRVCVPSASRGCQRRCLWRSRLQDRRSSTWRPTGSERRRSSTGNGGDTRRFSRCSLRRCSRYAGGAR